jgi:hypothetical protein
MKTILPFLLLSVFGLSEAMASGFSFQFNQPGFMDPEPSSVIHTTVHFDQVEVECMVDTGARLTIAKKSILANNKKVGESSGGGVSGQERVADLVESLVNAGDWTSVSGVIARTDQIPAECLLGNDFFMNRAFVIDFKEMKFSDGIPFSGEAYPIHQYPREGGGGHFALDLEIADETIPALFDTGSTATVIDLAFVEAHPEDFQFIEKIDVTEGSNQTVKAGIYRLKSLKIGPINEKDIEIYALDLSYLNSKIPGLKAILGLKQIKNYKWYIDNINARWGVY